MYLKMFDLNCKPTNHKYSLLIRTRYVKKANKTIISGYADGKKEVVYLHVFPDKPLHFMCIEIAYANWRNLIK